MRRCGSFTAFVAAFVLAASGSKAAAIDDANAAVLAADAGNYDDAIRHFTDALGSNELADRSRAQAFAYRGLSLAAKGNYAAALRDLDSAVALHSPYDSDAYSYRGFLEFALGRPADGAADLAKGADLLVWPYNTLWLSIARTKAGVPDAGEHSLKNNMAMLDLTRWPGPVLQFYLGDVTADGVQAAAGKGAIRRRRPAASATRISISENTISGAATRIWRSPISTVRRTTAPILPSSALARRPNSRIGESSGRQCSLAIWYHICYQCD